MSYFADHPEVEDALTYFGWIGEQLSFGRPATVDQGELAAHLTNLRQFVHASLSGALCPEIPDYPTTDDEWGELPPDINDDDLAFGFHVETYEEDA